MGHIFTSKKNLVSARKRLFSQQKHSGIGNVPLALRMHVVKTPTDKTNFFFWGRIIPVSTTYVRGASERYIVI